MELHNVMSSNIARIGYDPAMQLLLIQFTTGRAYEYYNFPEDVFDQFFRSTSKGRFFELYIKNRYQYKETNIS